MPRYILVGPRTSRNVDAGPVYIKPENVRLPTISGTPQVGQTLRAGVGLWTGNYLAYSYQWNADGLPIVGATGVSYDLTEDEIGADISVTVTATNVRGRGIATSAAVGPVLPTTIDSEFSTYLLVVLTDEF